MGIKSTPMEKQQRQSTKQRQNYILIQSQFKQPLCHRTRPKQWLTTIVTEKRKHLYNKNRTDNDRLNFTEPGQITSDKTICFLLCNN